MKVGVPGSLRVKLLGVVLLTTFVSLAVALGAMVAYDLHDFHRIWTNDMRTQAELLGRTTAPALLFDDAKSARENLGLMRSREQVRAAAIYGADGVLFATYGDGVDDGDFPVPPQTDRTQVRDGSLVVFKRIVENGEILGTVYLLADYPLRQKMLSYGQIAFVVTLLAMLVAVALSLRLQRRVTHPILAIAQIAREVVERRDYSRRAARLSDDEVGTLVESFNDMMAEVEQHAIALESSHREKEREVEERRRAQQEVMRLNEQLEQRVRERTAELVQAREAADAANRAKSAFLAAMSHEIRTPMNGVVGMVEVLSHSELSERQADAVKTIRESSFSLLSLIDDILDFSKIEAGRLDLERVPVALPELIESVCNTLLPVAIDKEVELDLFIDPRVPQQIWSDATRLRQLLYNLLGNAIKFSSGRPHRRGQVSVRVQMADGPSPRLVLQIADNGVGIAPETLPYLFSAFTQAESSTTRRFGGTGLGLAICKRLVALMKGEIHVESEPDVGSTFRVDLPIEAVQAAVPGVYPDLAGLDCIIVGSDGHAEDLGVYLVHAGARTHRVAGLDEAVQAVRGMTRPVVIQRTQDEAQSVHVVQEAFAGEPDVRHLLIVSGRHRCTRMPGANVVALPGNGMRRSGFLRAVAVAAGRASPEVLHSGGGPAPRADEAPPPSVAQSRAEGRLILVAEDDEVNQKVILRQIELLGHAAEVADNGAEALRMWRTGHYGLLLTDLHMPDMDGYDLASAIRREEAARAPAGQRRMPILALTANAMRGEQVRAEAAGMDEYLTKPLQLHLFEAALARWLPRDGGPPDAAPDPAELPSAAPVVDVAVLESLVGDDPGIVRQLLRDYQAAGRRMAAELREAHDAGDIRTVAAIVHKLKSSSRSVGALTLADRCVDLENACRTGAHEGIVHGAAQFELAWRAVDAEVDDILARP